MKIEERDGDRVTYTEVINGRVCRATTINGEAGAKKIFDIYRAGGGIGRSRPISQDIEPGPHRR